MQQKLKRNDRFHDYARNITFILTEDCQLRCKYCYLTGKNSTRKMSFDIAAEAVDKILNMDELVFENECVVWDFIGGEPLMETELMDKICDYIKIRMFEKNHPWFNLYRFSISTNGLLYGSPKVQEFIRKNREHLSIGISIDGHKEKHDSQRIYPNGKGSYDEVLKNIPLWLQQFPEAATKATIARNDLPYIMDSVLHLWSIGIRNVNMNTVFEDCWQEGDDAVFENQLTMLADKIIEKRYYVDYHCSLFERYLSEPARGSDSNWCGAGKMIAVGCDGNFYPCVRFVDYSLNNRKGLKTGDSKTGIDKNLLRPFDTLCKSVQSSSECLACPDSNGCAWCQGANYDLAASDTIFQRITHICKMHKARVRANKYFWNKLDKTLAENGN
jgi:uncharacterized protein